MAWDTPLWEQQRSRKTAWGSASPLLVVGIFIFVLPYFNGVGNLHFGSYLSWIGGVFMVLGIIHSIGKMIN